jgi:hypothetical protein
VSSMNALAWVFAPAVSDGHVVYRYRNAGTEPLHVDEDVSAFTHDSLDAGMQHFVLEALAPEDEQETHVPFGFDLPDGDYVVLVSIGARLDSLDPDRLDGRVTCTISGGALHAAGTVSHAEPELGIDIHDFTLDGEHAAVTYSLSGTVWPTSMDCWFTLSHQDAVVWEGGEEPQPQASGIVHSPVPVSLVQPGDGWRLTVRVHVHHSPSGADNSWQAHLPIAHDAQGTVAPSGPWTVDLSDI